MDARPGSPLIGADYTFHLPDGRRLHGSVLAAEGGWLQVRTAGGVEVMLNLGQVVYYGQDAGTVESEAGSGRRRRNLGDQAGAWQDDELRLLAQAFLDGVSSKDLATEFGRSTGAINQLRLAFEAGRGNQDEDRLSDAAKAWVPRWRRLLAKT